MEFFRLTFTCVRAQYVAKAQYVTIVTYWAQNAKFDWIFKNSAQYVAKFFLIVEI